MRLKSALVLFAGTLLSSTALASGYYLGIGVGPNSGQVEYNSTFSNGAASQQDSYYYLPGAEESVFTGYQWGFGNFLLGLEGYGDIAQSSTSVQVGNVEFKHQYQWNAGLRLLTGAQIDRNNEVLISLGGTAGHFVRSGDEFNSAGNNYSKTLLGTQGGLAFATFLTPHVYLRFHYLYNYYGRFTTVDNSAVGIDTSTYTMQGDQYLIALAYQFGNNNTNQDDIFGALDHTHFYMGGHIAHDSTGMDYLQNGNGGTLQDHHSSLTGPDLQWHFGEYFAMDWFNLALEFSSGYSFAEFHSSWPNTPVLDEALKQGFDFGFSVLPGIRVNSANRVFARLGIKWGQFSWCGNNPTSLDTSFHDYATGFEYGVGDELYLTQRTSLVLQFTQTLYGKLDQFANDGTRFPLKPTEDEYSLGFNVAI